MLHDPSELIGVKPEAMLVRDARLEPGADQIVNELLGRSGAASGPHDRDAAPRAKSPMGKELDLIMAAPR